MRDGISQKLLALPDAPGVYLMKDAAGDIFYVGKARSLRDRVRSYFSGSDTRAFVALLDKWLADVEVILTHTDKEALILENELIKKHQPRFNVKLTDDSRYLCLRLDTRHPYPRLEMVRHFGKDAARYFGPYHSAVAIRATLRLMNRYFQLRTCSDGVLVSRKRPCLQYQIKRCPAPCVFDLSDGRYAENVSNVVAFLEGRTNALLQHLTVRMQEHAANMAYEAAAAVRDQRRAVERSLERQQVVSSDFANRDVVGLYRQGPAVEIHVMRTREGRLVDARRFSLRKQEAPTPEVLADFAMRYYAECRDVPREIVFPELMEWAEPMAEFLSELRGRPVAVVVPKRGNKLRLVELSNRNAKQAFHDKQRETDAAQDAVDKLKRALHLTNLPQRIECFDISHLQGDHITASCVRLHDGTPHKALYRRYKIRSTEGQNDFQAMYEVISRRARRGLEDADLPDLIVVDGGKGQLSAARAALDDFGIDGVDLVGLAKSRTTTIQAGENGADEVNKSPERVFVTQQKNPIVLRQDSAELFLLTRARDEAHRFALAFHQKLRGQSSQKSLLESLTGVGPKRRQKLLRHFGSLKQIRQASEGEIAAVVGTRLARTIVAALRREPQGETTR